MTSSPGPEPSDALQAAFALGDDDGFEAVYTRLEGVTKRLEEGGLTLDQTLALYEQGIALSRRAQALLDAAEQRIEVLRQGGD
ncbi:MAG: exodeoxyribonuclease VII small subunit [Dehalococcoidia bacterium]|nr:MAG: exodeoxyribonuclease VII small subunit [Dehalococcoidia bacterium]